VERVNGPARPNKALQPTLPCGPKIERILETSSILIVISIYRCGAAERQAVGPPVNSVPLERSCEGSGVNT